MALYCPSSSLRSLVRTFPRTLSKRACGKSSCACRVRRLEDVPMGFEKSISEMSAMPSGSTSTSRGSSRPEKPMTSRSSGISAGRSFRLWTERSVRPSRSAWSSSLTKSPFPPISSRRLWRILSPVVFIVTSSICICGKCSRR